MEGAALDLRPNPGCPFTSTSSCSTITTRGPGRGEASRGGSFTSQRRLTKQLHSTISLSLCLAQANDIAESAETAGEQLDDFIAEVEGGDEDKIKESLETLQQTVEDETEMAEQLEDDASLIASEAEQAALRAETEKQNIIQEADNLGLDLETN